MKTIFLFLTLLFCFVMILSFTQEKIVVSPKIVLKEQDVVVKKRVVSEQTQLIQSMKEEVDELYETTYKLNRLLIKKHQGEHDVRDTESRTPRSRDTHRGRNGLYLTTQSKR